MKKFFSYLGALLLAASFCVACSNEEPAMGNAPIQLDKDTQKEQVVYADETSKSNGIKFTTTTNWQATVRNVTADYASEVEWLQLSAYKGGAGKHTLAMTLQRNLTGNDRVAEIIITCGETVINIRVEQKGTKQDGQQPEGAGIIYIDQIIVRFSQGPYYLQEISKLTYTDNGRLKSMETYPDCNNNGVIDAEELNMRSNASEIEYDDANKKAIVTYEGKDDINIYTEKGECLLDSNGYITQVTFKSYVNNVIESEEITSFTYDDRGYVVGSKTGNIQKTGHWVNGNLVRIEDIARNMYSNASYSTIPNNPKIAIDLSRLIPASEVYLWYPHPIDCLAAAGLIGKRNSHMLLKEEVTGAYEETFQFIYSTNANGLIQKVRTDSDIYGNYEYTFVYRK